jgi:hypothetical protein
LTLTARQRARFCGGQSCHPNSLEQFGRDYTRSCQADIVNGQRHIVKWAFVFKQCRVLVHHAHMTIL